ncbi:MAG: hypothetical protein MjAS7_1622 [Metallosphaera javensis (ex Sakai et al. 2022)]|nr:MAG: hypothetical protein MjAS7_1622 [Metallosphaera javensis (ex Sakai et al. 2022)]
MVIKDRRIDRLRWMSVRLPMYDGKGRVRTGLRGRRNLCSGSCSLALCVSFYTVLSE